MSEQHTPAWRLITTLSVAGAIAGFLIVFAFQWAQPRILAYKATVLEAAIGEVLGKPDSIKTLFLYQGTLTAEVPASVDTTTLERVFAGYNDELIGYAIVAAEPGFADVITLIFGYDVGNQRVLGMKVLDNKETPGLGDKIVKDTNFVAEFLGVATPLTGVKPGAGKGQPNEVDMITGATISSRTVIGIINHKLEKIAPLLPQGAQP
jgi:electron transport complex protein RnfG